VTKNAREEARKRKNTESRYDSVRLLAVFRYLQCIQSDILSESLRLSLARNMCLRKARNPVTPKPPGSDTVFTRPNGTTVTQDLFEPCVSKTSVLPAAVVETSIKKGLRRILQERGLWMSDLTAATARQLLKTQPDFAAQPE